MIEPIIGFTIFFIVVSLIIYIGNKTTKIEYNNILEKIKDEIVFKKEQSECLNMTIGLKNRNYLFRHCDIYITDHSTILFGYSKNRLIKQLSKPIILTNKKLQIVEKFPNAIIKEINRLNKGKNDLVIEFGEKGITKTHVTIRLKNLNEFEQNKLHTLINKTAANNGYKK